MPPSRPSAWSSPSVAPGRSTGSTCGSRRAPFSAVSGPTAPARRRRYGSSRPSSSPTPATPRWPASTSSREAELVRHRDRPRRSAGRRRRAAHRSRQPGDGRAPLPPQGDSGPQARRRTTRALRPDRCRQTGWPRRTPAACAGASTSPPASSSRPRSSSSTSPPLGSTLAAARDMWDVIGELVADGATRAADDPVPRRGRPPRRPHRRHRRRPGDRGRHRRRVEDAGSAPTASTSWSATPTVSATPPPSSDASLARRRPSIAASDAWRSPCRTSWRRCRTR